MTGKIFRSCVLVGVAVMVLCMALFLAAMASRYVEEVYHQLEVTADYARQEKLDTAVDALREKFGEGALFRAALLHSDERMAGGLHKKRRTGITKPIEDEAARIRKKYGNND